MPLVFAPANCSQQEALTLKNHQVRFEPGVRDLNRLDFGLQTLTDALGNRRAVNLGRHDRRVVERAMGGGRRD